MKPTQRSCNGQVTYAEEYHSFFVYIVAFRCCGHDSKGVSSKRRCEYGQGSQSENCGRQAKANKAPRRMGEKWIGESHDKFSK